MIVRNNTFCMDHRDLHHIIGNLSARLTCPHCKTRISQNALKILDVLEDNCVFYVACPKCRSNMILGAHLEHIKTRQALTSNISTIIQHEQKKSEITEEEIRYITSSLKGFKSNFDKLFQ